MGDVADMFVAQVRNNLSKWEDDEAPLAPLGAPERDSVIELASHSLWRENALFQNLSHQDDSASNSILTGSLQNKCFGVKFTNQTKSIFNNIECTVESSQQFLNWYATVEADIEKEEDGPYEEYVSQLKNHRGECRSLLSQLNEALENLQKLSDQYTSVSIKTSSLHNDCEHLLAEQTRLSNGADTIENRLSYFLEVNKISQKLSSPAFQVSNDGFITLLSKINECINYMNSNTTYKESSIYLAKYRQCLNRALSMVKSYVTKSLENALHQVLPQPGSEKPSTDNALILYYGKFRMCAPRIKILMSEIEDRIEVSPEYSNLLNDCHQCYFSQRKILLEPCVLDAVTQLTQKYSRDYCSLVRSGCAFLVHVCEDEYSLFHQFFSVSSPELEKFVQELCFVLYDALRPLIIHIDHLETLSELCNILRRGMIEEHIQNNPIQLAPLTSVVNQLLQDCQERLIYRAQIYMQTDIINFNPSPGDLAYPSKLEMMESIAESLSHQQKSNNNFIHNRGTSISSMTSIRSSISEDASVNTINDERFSRVGSSPADLHGMWYPTVRRTLMCLSKVYRSVDRSIFQGVSLEALSSCMQSLSNAALSISKTSSLLDAQLFEIKHLLILREQLAPFQVDASVREMCLDWSKLKDAAYGLVQKRNRLFSLTSNNSLLEFIVEGTPQVTEHILDSKRNVDNELKKDCEQLIYSTTESLVSPLTAFLAKVEVILKMNQEKDVKPISLKNQPFGTPEKVADAVSNTQKILKTKVPSIQKSFRLYLANKDTEFILFKPIRANVLAEFRKVKEIVTENYTEDDRIIIACPSQEEISILISSLFVT